jgi:hypothetical protein
VVDLKEVCGEVEKICYEFNQVCGEPKVCAVILGGRHKSSKTRRLSPFTEFVV